MDEIPVTPFSSTLVESPVHSSTTWSMSDDHPSQQKPKADILAMPERLNDVPEWLRTPVPLPAPETTQLACEDCPTLNQTAFQSIEPHDNLFHPAL